MRVDMLVTWAVAATALSIVFGCILCIYRRQVKDICRQLSFLHEEVTNLRITGSTPYGDLNQMIDGINILIDDVAARIRDQAAGETVLKETITNLSHDIRTPLTSMNGYFTLLAQSTDEGERVHYIEIIRRRLASLELILEELFVYTKLQDEHYEIELETVDFHKCVFDMVFSYYEEFERRGIVPELDFCEESCPVTGNEEALQRILQNIIKNAMVHGAGKIRFGLRQQGRAVVFLCANELREELDIDVDQIFKRFYKMDRARSLGSSGLGLSIARGLTERMEGKISAKVCDGWFEIKVELPARKEKT